MDITLIPAAYNTLKFVKDALEVALGYKIENESREQINAALKQVGTIQDTLFHIREELFQLQTENERLRQQLEAKEKWESLKSQYQLQETAGGAVAYGFTGTPKHYACPSCFHKANIQVLQDQRDMNGSFQCPGCKTDFLIKPEQSDLSVLYYNESIKRRMRDQS